MDDSLVLKLETLANLKLTPAKRTAFRNDLEKIFTMIDKMAELDTDNVKPLIYVNEEPYVLRKDQVSNELDVEKAMENAPNSKGNYFVVPKFVKV